MGKSNYPGYAAILLGACMAPAVHANPTGCSFGGLERTIEVVYAYPGQAVPCEVIYNKSMEGSVQTLWRAHHEAGYCEARASGLVDDLVALGWHCEAVPARETELPAELMRDDGISPGEQLGSDQAERLGDQPPQDTEGQHRVPR